MSRLVAHPAGSWLSPDAGTLTPQEAVLRAMANKQVVLVGERHDIAEIHRWQAYMCAFLHTLRPHMAVGFEMFPHRLQPVLDAWVGGDLTTADFLVASEWDTVWGFPPEIYLPIFHFCRQQKVRMLALNCHRPLVTRVGVEGWDGIPADERDGLTPAAPATAAYRQYLWDLGMRRSGVTGPDDPAFARFWRAQQCWDRAFACHIANAISADPQLLVVGIIGRGHLEYGHGTPFQLRDLGVKDIGVLLPGDHDMVDVAQCSGIADALFRLVPPEPPAQRAPRPQAPPAPAEAQAAAPEAGTP